MPTLKELRHELKEKRRQEAYTKNDILVLRAAWLKEQPQKCEDCGRIEDLTVDHIVPLELLRNFGINVETELLEEDLKVLCRRCNQYKGHRLDFKDPRTKVLLLKYLERV